MGGRGRENGTCGWFRHRRVAWCTSTRRGRRRCMSVNDATSNTRSGVCSVARCSSRTIASRRTSSRIHSAVAIVASEDWCSRRLVSRATRITGPESGGSTRRARTSPLCPGTPPCKRYIGRAACTTMRANLRFFFSRWMVRNGERRTGTGALPCADLLCDARSSTAKYKRACAQ